MTFSRTVYTHPILGEPLDASAILAATLDALDYAPRRYGDAVPIQAAYSRCAARPEIECDDLPVALPLTVRPDGTRVATLVDWREELAAEVDVARDRDRRRRRA